MVVTKCKECNTPLSIDEDDNIPGCRDTENVICPKCKKIATTVSTSGIPSAEIISEDDYNKVIKSFDS
ncbi:hypothetical protein [uncultured Clostridium sp.]|uniref:hypothetical protein n=1 Tax=uncultured Clostridium sp. TaxID=59620 RepID=UPI0028E6BC1D|nr:hypothetical protein [uncultured Clostridium sp.]